MNGIIRIIGKRKILFLQPIYHNLLDRLMEHEHRRIIYNNKIILKTTCRRWFEFGYKLRIKHVNNIIISDSVDIARACREFAKQDNIKNIIRTRIVNSKNVQLEAIHKCVWSVS